MAFQNTRMVLCKFGQVRYESLGGIDVTYKFVVLCEMKGNFRGNQTVFHRIACEDYQRPA